MIDFSKLRFDDASINEIRISPTTVEVEYSNWQEKKHTLIFRNAISCFSLSPHGKALSHGQLETEGSYLSECCEIAEEDSIADFSVFNFIDVWSEQKILRIVAESVDQIS